MLKTAPCESFGEVPPEQVQDRKERNEGDGGNIQWKSSEVNTRAVYRGQNKLIEFKMAVGDVISIKLSSGDLFIFSVRLSSFFSYFL